MTLLSNPRLAVFGLLMIVLLATGIAMFFLMTPIYGIVGTGIAAFADWTMFKILRRQMRTSVTIGEDGAHFDLYGEERIDLPWPRVTLAGLAVEKGKSGRRASQLFFYKEDGDQLMAVPAEFDRFAVLVAEARRLSPVFRDITLEEGETLKERLRSLFLPPTGASPGSSPATPSDPHAESSEPT
jgi:hypothetical protein